MFNSKPGNPEITALMKMSFKQTCGLDVSFPCNLCTLSTLHVVVKSMFKNRSYFLPLSHLFFFGFSLLGSLPCLPLTSPTGRPRVADSFDTDVITCGSPQATKLRIDSPPSFSFFYSFTRSAASFLCSSHLVSLFMSFPVGSCLTLLIIPLLR